MEEGFKVSAILLAAGLSTRMGLDKLLLPFQGLTLLEHTIGVISAFPFYQRILVTTQARLSVINLDKKIKAIVNSNPELGQSGSIRLGVMNATGDAYMFFMADQPLLDHAAIEALLRYADGEHIVYPIFNEVPCTPAIFPAKFREELLSVQGDQGGRQIRQSHPDACLPIELRSGAPLLLDVDTWEDYCAVMKN